MSLKSWSCQGGPEPQRTASPLRKSLAHFVVAACWNPEEHPRRLNNKVASTLFYVTHVVRKLKRAKPLAGVVLLSPPPALETVAAPTQKEHLIHARLQQTEQSQYLLESLKGVVRSPPFVPGHPNQPLGLPPPPSPATAPLHARYRADPSRTASRGGIRWSIMSRAGTTCGFTTAATPVVVGEMVAVAVLLRSASLLVSSAAICTSVSSLSTSEHEFVGSNLVRGVWSRVFSKSQGYAKAAPGVENGQEGVLHTRTGGGFSRRWHQRLLQSVRN